MSTTEQMHFEVHGGKKLRGEVTIGGSKNGTVALLSAALLNKSPTTLRNVPKIEEVYRLLEVLESIGMEAVWEKDTLTLIPPVVYNLKNLNLVSAKRTRSILMFAGPLLHLFETFSLPHSGGCKLGSRTVRPHFYALEKLGVTIKTKNDEWVFSREKLHASEIIMYESSDTATENAIMAASLIPQVTTIKYASANYQVQELCFFLETCGIQIDGVGTTTLTIHGKKSIAKPIVYTLSEDPIVAMLYLSVAIVTRSSIVIKRAPIEFLEQELLVLEKMGFRYEILKRYISTNKRTKLVDIKTLPSVLKAPEDKIHARPYPGLNMDNLPFFAAIATQARGTSLIHDWMYEKRALYLTDLDKLGGETILADPHRIYIEGPRELRPAEIVAPPALRPAVVLLVAMLAAKGRSVLRNVYPINRGYEDIVGNLRSLGADVSILKS